MSQSITVELKFFAISILWGALVLLAYDQLRVLRRIIRHNNFLVTVQDLIFWVLASVFIFAMIYTKNSGTIRGFSIMGMVIGMLIYHYVFSDLIVTIISRGILFILYPFSYILKCIKKGFRFIIKLIKKYMFGIFMRLKNLVKSIKIILQKRKKTGSEAKKIKNKKQRENRKSKNKGKVKKKVKDVI